MKIKYFLLMAMTVLLAGCPDNPGPIDYDDWDDWGNESPSTQPQETDYEDLVSRNVRIDVRDRKYIWDISVTTSLNPTIDGNNVSYIFEFGLDNYYDYFINIPFNGTPVLDLETNSWAKNVYGKYCSIENVYRAFRINHVSTKRIDFAPGIFLCDGEELFYYESYLALVDEMNSSEGFILNHEEVYYSVCDLLEKFCDKDAWRFSWRIIVKIGRQSYIVKSDKYQYNKY